MTPLQILKAAKEIISNPYSWTQKTLFRDAWGHALCQDKGEHACQFCAVGSLMKAANWPSTAVMQDKESSYYIARKYLKKAKDMPIHDYNDSHTHQEVLSKFDEAIALVESED